MEKRVLNYRIVIKPEKQKNSVIYLAECPTLGVFDWGKTIEEALKNIQEAVACEVEGLLHEREQVPVDYPEKELIASTHISLSGTQVAF